MWRVIILWVCVAVVQLPYKPSFADDGYAHTFNSHYNNSKKEYFFTQINFNNIKSLSVPELDKIVDKYENRSLHITDLQQMLDDVTAGLIEQGAFLSRASLSQESFSKGRAGYLSVDISEGFVSQIHFSNPDHQPLEKYFSSLLAERPATLSTYQQALLALTRMPGVQLESYKQRKDPDIPNGYIVELKVKVANYSVFASVTNRGQRNGEATKAFIGTNLFSKFRKGDVLRLGFITKPTAVEEFKFATIGYQMPFWDKNTEFVMSANYSETKPLTALASRNLAGETIRGSFGIRRTLHHDRARRIWIEASLDAVDAKEEEDLSRLYSDKLRVLRTGAGVSYNGRNKSVTNFYIEASQGLDVLGADDIVGLEASRPDGDAVFTKLTAELRHNRDLVRSVRLKLGAIAQLSKTPLLFSEEFSFGGGDYGRGYDFGEIMGDSGFGAFAELSFYQSGSPLLKEWEVYGFADTGTVWNAGNGFSIDGEFLSSAGAGIRLATKQKLNFAYEAAQPLSDAPFTLDDEDVRHRLDVSIDFQR